MSENFTDFGFKKVNSKEKANLVKGIFSNVAKKYDLMNDLMSGGLHRAWKNEMIKEIDFHKNNLKFIDVAGGTGDIAFRITKKAMQNNLTHEIEVVDINQAMLDVGQQRAIDNNLFKNLKFICADGEKLPYEDETFDYFTIAFGIRNFTNIAQGLKEAHRLLKKGGKFICLEFSKVNNIYLQKFYDCYSFNVIPKIGEKILNDRESYQYLVESIKKFPSQNEFKKMIEEAKFTKAQYQNLTFGICAIHTAIKL